MFLRCQIIKLTIFLNFRKHKKVQYLAHKKTSTTDLPFRTDVLSLGYNHRSLKNLTTGITLQGTLIYELYCVNHKEKLQRLKKFVYFCLLTIHTKV